MSGFTTRESAHDLEALRGRLGVPQLSLLAGSFGTHLALAYAREYPESVQRMVLAGVEGPDHTLKLPSRVQHVRAEIAAAKRPTLLADNFAPLAQWALRDRAPRRLNPMNLPVISGEFDGRTPVANAHDIAANMPHAQLMLVRGASHGLFGAPEVSEAMLAFLRGGV